MMKLLVCLLGMLVLTGAQAQVQDIDVEALREILHRLVATGNPVTVEALEPVFESFSGLEKEILQRYTAQLASLSEAEELLLHDLIADLQAFLNLLFNLKSVGGAVSVKVAETILDVLSDTARRVLTSLVAQWKKNGSVALTSTVKSNINAAITAVRQVINDSSNRAIYEKLKAKAAGAANGMAKSALNSAIQTIESLMLRHGSFQVSVQADEDIMLSQDDIPASLSQVDKVLNREVVDFLSSSMLKQGKATTKEQVTLLLRRIYDNNELPAVLEAIQKALS